MDIKRDILWRVYLSYLVIVIVCITIIGKAFYIQQVQGKKWISMSDSLHQKIEDVEAERGTIYSEDGQMLSTSIPQFDIYIDFGADGLREKDGKRFKENIDSLCSMLSGLFKDKLPGEYKKILKQQYRDQNRYYLLKKNIGYHDFQQLKTFPLVRLGRNKSGFKIENKSIRLNPYKLLAFRTIGLARDSFKVGLEMTYDTLLKGRAGRRLVRYITGGIGVPVDDLQVEPENGKDIVSTIDVFIQEITENALLKMMTINEAEHGCAIVMETKTGKIKAIANLGRTKEGNYFEDFNYAINPAEPGSTFKLATMISLLEDKKISLNTPVNLEGGLWKINGQTVYDSEQHGKYEVTAKQAFELSSNVGMAKLVWNNYAGNPSQFINHLHKMHLDTLTGIDLKGERNSLIYKPGNRYWNSNTLPWMAFGYNLTVTPLQVLNLYNAVANNGKMMKPYLVSSVKQEGQLINTFQPYVLDQKICSDETLKEIKECLEGVCTEGTAKSIFKNSPYKVAGKTGTALVANGSRGYADQIYQASFGGYFPADNPQYTCLIVIKNKPMAVKRHGAEVAAPVFKEIADRLYATCVHNSENVMSVAAQKDSLSLKYFGYKTDVRQLVNYFNIKVTDSTGNENDWICLNESKGRGHISDFKMEKNEMPLLKGLGLKDALYLCENIGLKVNIKGKGKVSDQSILAGQVFSKGQIVNIQFN